LITVEDGYRESAESWKTVLRDLKRRGMRAPVVVVGDGALDYVIDRVIKGLFESKHIEEVFMDDTELRKVVQAAIQKYLGVDEELDREVRGRLKNLREGTTEWEVEYGRLIEQMRGTKAL